MAFFTPYTFYVIPKDYPELYRGFSSRIEIDPNKAYFVTTAELAAEDYGVVVKIVPTRNLYVIALDDPASAKQLYNQSPDNIQKIMRENYGYNTETHKLDYRDSVFKKDVEFSKYLCSLGFDGYATQKMPMKDYSDFHDEIMLCNPGEQITIGEMVSSPKKIERLEEKIRHRKLQQEDREKRQKGKRGIEPEISEEEQEKLLAALISSNRSNVSPGSPNGSPKKQSRSRSTSRGGKRKRKTVRRLTSQIERGEF